MKLKCVVTVLTLVGLSWSRTAYCGAWSGQLGEACTNGLGICAAKGQLVSDGADGVVCDAVPWPPQAEICGDFQDSDCDGNLNDGCADTDGDGLFDTVEIAIGTDPLDADSDDDGVLDGSEPSYSADSDGDGLINALDPDSDNDGLFDGTELGLDCDNKAVDMSKGHCIADTDSGLTTTNPLLSDTDHGGLTDGAEDTNHDGRVEEGERDPNLGADDLAACTTDAECGGATSGRVCDAAFTCVDGCHSPGNGCPSDRVCTSVSAQMGFCHEVPATTSSGTGGEGGTGGSGAGGSTGSGDPTTSRGGMRPGSGSGPGSSTAVSPPGDPDPTVASPSGSGGAAGESLTGGGCSVGQRSSSEGGGFASMLAIVGGLVLARRRRS